EQQTLYNAANFNVPGFNDPLGDLTNRTIHTTKLTMFLCPSDPPPTWDMEGTVAQDDVVPAPGNTYFASLGSSLEFDASYTGGPPNGVFAYQGATRATTYTLVANATSFKPPTLASVTDGTSNTVAFGERKTGTGNLNVVTIPQDIIIFLGSGFPPGITRN